MLTRPRSCRLIRHDPAVDRIKIVVIMGPSDGRMVQRLEKAGADACIQEPLDHHELVARIGDMLGVMLRSSTG